MSLRLFVPFWCYNNPKSGTASHVGVTKKNCLLAIAVPSIWPPLDLSIRVVFPLITRPISVGFASNECREIEFIVPQIYRLKYMLVYAYIRRNH